MDEEPRKEASQFPEYDPLRYLHVPWWRRKRRDESEPDDDGAGGFDLDWYKDNPGPLEPLR